MNYLLFWWISKNCQNNNVFFLVFLVQNGAEPTINDNNIEMCLIGKYIIKSKFILLAKNL